MPLGGLIRSAAGRLRAYLRLERLVLALGAIFIVEMSVSTAMYVARSRADAIEEWRGYMDHFATMTAAHANQTIQGCDLLLQRVLDRVAANGIDDEASFRRIMGSRETYDLIKEEAAGLIQTDVVTIADAKGDVINLSRSYPPPPGMNLADREHFRVQMEDPDLAVFVSRPVITKTTGRWVFFLSRKIRGKSGRVLGMVSTGIESAFLSNFYRSVSI